MARRASLRRAGSWAGGPFGSRRSTSWSGSASSLLRCIVDNPPPLDRTISPFLRLLVAIARAEVDFAVVGGVAVCLNNHVRYTADADILVNPSPENVKRLLAVLSLWGEGWARELKPEEFVAQEGSICVSEEFDLDIFTQMRGRTLDDFRPRLRNFDAQGVRIPFLAPEDLIALKEGSWREKDQWDVVELRRVLAQRRPPNGPID